MQTQGRCEDEALCFDLFQNGSHLTGTLDLGLTKPRNLNSEMRKAEKKGTRALKADY